MPADRGTLAPETPETPETTDERSRRDMPMRQARPNGPGRPHASGHPETSDGAPSALAGLVDLLGRRFALAVYWNLRGTALPFRALVARLDAPQAQVTQRLRELREAGLVEVDEVGEYRLTAHGRRLQGVLEPLAAWADDWSGLSPRQRTPRGSATQGHGEP
ncbi:transcriptional regulator [Frankia sp. B2]|uniref:winged helix-turn-helix transcriptional regulator n=1 Tax=Frankia TaxID=1854 RepID=UPI0005529E44|nr:MULTISPECIES: winged helix-turn-helix transcriptional regulator [Frankia]TFE23517.1 transcriptional regulator [Frankia sp. B2]